MVLPDAKALARTYNPPSYPDPWECVEDYQRVIEYAAANPQKGSQAVSTSLDLPRSRIRPWLNDSIPDVVRGIQTAEANSWLTDHATPEQSRAFTQLAAWLLSGGSLHLSETGARTSFIIDKPHLQDLFDDLATTAQIDYKLIREDVSEQAAEARPTTDASVLARVFHALGLPTGPKNETTLDGLPAFVSELNDAERQAFVRVYVLNRGAEHQDKDTLTIREKRSEAYLSDLTQLLWNVAGDPVTRSGKTITISAAAARELRTPVSA